MTSKNKEPSIQLDMLSLDDLEHMANEVAAKKDAPFPKKTPGRKPGDLSNDRLRRIVEAHLAIETQEAAEAGALGYMARALTLATMPHSRYEGNEFHGVSSFSVQ